MSDDLNDQHFRSIQTRNFGNYKVTDIQALEIKLTMKNVPYSLLKKLISPF